MKQFMGMVLLFLDQRIFISLEQYVTYRVPSDAGLSIVSSHYYVHEAYRRVETRHR